MRLEKLQLINFKNYESAQLDFRGNVHCFLGKNGSGKTNLLEAIHYLSFTKGGMHTHDASNVRHGADHFSIAGTIEKLNRKFEIACTFSGERKKRMTENGKDYTRFSEHIGKFPLVLIAPHDAELITGSGEPRRRFFDTLLSQIDKEYLSALMVYQSHLKQRNSLLRMFAERGAVDADLLATYDASLVAAGLKLFESRTAFMKDFIPVLQKNYEWVSAGRLETAAISYESHLQEDDFAAILKRQQPQDIALGRTTAGVHRDDFVFTLQDHDLRTYGSQGQQKTFLIALRMAEFQTLNTRNGFKPFLLLDDIFDKLDDDRIHRLVEMMQSDTFGQIFITDARPARSLEVLREAKVTSQNFRVVNGQVEEG